MDICCQYLSDTQNIESPFGRIFGTDWYDGLLSGFAECRECGTAYWFSVVGWDYSIPERVYAFMPLLTGDFNRILQSVDSLGLPNWPCWIPIWQFKDTAQQLTAEQEIHKAITNANQPHYLISAESLELRIIFIRELCDETVIREVSAAVQEGEAESSKELLAKWLLLLHRT